MAKALITGICGFVGSHLACLLYSEGIEVVGMDMSDKTLNKDLQAHIDKGNIKVFKGDLLSFDFDTIGVVDYIYQIAGKVSVWGDIAVFNRINVDGTKRVIDYAKNINCKVMVYLSSTAVYGYYGYTELNEDAEKRPMQNPYSLSKLAAETMVKDYCSSIKQNYIIIRPGNIYGEYDMTSSYDLYRLVSKGKMPVIDNGRHKSCFVYVKNLVKGIYQSSITPKAYNEDYNLTDGFGETLNEYLTNVAKALGAKPKFMSVPAVVSKTIARIVEGIYKLLRIKTMPLITLFSVLQNSVDYHFSIKKAKEHFDYNPLISLEEGTKHTAEWFSSMPKDIKVKR